MKSLRPLNGQAKRIEVVSEIFEKLPIATIVETGTYRGVTTRYLAHRTSAPVYTVEVNPRLFFYSRRALRKERNVEVVEGDSRKLLRRLGGSQSVAKSTTFFYLNAHWEDDLPLKDELTLISDMWDSWIVLIDDFEVPGDHGYGFDDYGPGKRLELTYIPRSVLEEGVAFWPAATSREESGFRRGSVVLSSLGDVTDTVRQFKSLRVHSNDASGTNGLPRHV